MKGGKVITEAIGVMDYVERQVAVIATILNFYSISKILEYRPDVITLFVKPAVASGIMGIVCFGCYQLLYQFLGKAIPMLISVVVAVVVYFAVAVKCKLLTESVMRDLPKGSMQFLA